MAETNNERMEAVTTVSSNSGKVGKGVSLPFTCDECEKVCRNKAGLTLHKRKAHAITFHVTNVPEVRVKNRWNEDEIYQLARREAQLVISGIQARKINSLLYEQFPERSQEAIKGQRRKAEYKDIACTLTQGVKLTGETPQTCGE